MPARKTRTGRATTTTRRPRATQAVDGAAAKLISNLNEVIAENAALRKQNEPLQGLLVTIGGLVADVATASPTNGRRTRGRRSTAAGGSTATIAPTRRKRRPITDPVVLEKRRAALAKARQVRAQKRVGQSA